MGCINTELDADVKNDVLFLDKIMNIVKNEETSALFTPFVIKMKQICKSSWVSFRKKIKANHEVEKNIVKSTENVESEATRENVESQGVIEDLETEEEMDNCDSNVNDGKIFDILTFYRN